MTHHTSEDAEHRRTEDPWKRLRGRGRSRNIFPGGRSDRGRECASSEDGESLLLDEDDERLLAEDDDDDDDDEGSPDLNDVLELFASTLATPEGDTVANALSNIAQTLENQNRILIKILSTLGR